MKKDWRERELTMEVVVGAFMVMIFLGIGYFTIILSKETWFSEKTEMNVTFGNVMGLRDGDSVVVRGMPIGKVKTLALVDSEGCVGVCVNLLLDKPLSIHEGYEMKIVATSMLGGRQLQINEGPDDAPVIKLDQYTGKDPYDIMEDAADIVNAARTEIVKGAVFSKIRNVTDQVDEMVTRVNSGKGVLGRVLSEDDTLYTDLESAVQSLKNMVSRVEQGHGSVGRLLSDDSTLHDDLAEAVASIKRMAQRIEKGEGTAGRFMSDDTLYEEVEATVGEVRAAIDDFRETAPVTTFTSIFFGAL
jgi:phospholipid/cholesterol/gamma-HCH transport system substrate-binding protein